MSRMLRTARVGTLAAPVMVGLLVSLLSVPLAAPLAAQDWAGRGRLNGSVHDEADKPIEGAIVTLRNAKIPENGPPDQKTDKKGKWSYLGLLGGSWDVKINAEGYVPSEGTVSVNEFGPNPLVAIKLRKAVAVQNAPAEDPKLKTAQEAIDKGDALLQSKDAAGARAEYEKALPLLDGKNRLIILKRIATCQMVEGNDTAAVETLKGVLAEAPEDADALRLIVDRLIVLKRDAEASEYMAKMPQGAAGLDPNTVLNMGINLYNENKLDDAVAKFDQVISIRPDGPEGYYYRGLALLAQGKTKEAKPDFEKVLALDPNFQYANDCRDFLKSL